MGQAIQSYSHECLSNFRLPTFGFHGIKKKKKKKAQEMIICISANLSSQILTDKMNAVKLWHDGRFCVHMPKCVRNSSPHLSFNNTMGCHLAFTLHWLMRGGHGTVPPPDSPKIDPRVSCPSWQQWVFLVMTHCQKATQSSNLPRYLSSEILNTSETWSLQI